MSAIYEPCSFCGRRVRADERADDGACLGCQGYDCMRCHASPAEPYCSLCLGCAESLGVAPLLGLVGRDVSVQLRDERRVGLACGPWLHYGEVEFVLDVSAGDAGPLLKLPLDEIVRIEPCVRDALAGATWHGPASIAGEREAEGDGQSCPEESPGGRTTAEPSSEGGGR